MVVVEFVRWIWRNTQNRNRLTQLTVELIYVTILHLI